MIASTVKTYHRRKPKASTDWRDLAHLLMTFPKLKTEEGPGKERLVAAEAEPEVSPLWRQLVAAQILPEDEDDEFL